MHIQVLPNGQDDIEGIRVVRHPETLIGKGIGYLCLASHEAVLRALTLNNCKFKKMKLRVTTCGKRTKRTEQQRLQRTQSDGTGVSGGGGGGRLEPSPAEAPPTAEASSETSGRGGGGSAGGSKKRKAPAAESPAARRLKMKVSSQRRVCGALTLRPFCRSVHWHRRRRR